jgi:hypothetical protein
MKRAFLAVLLAGLVLAVTPARCANIVLNPGFESGSFTPWVESGWGVDSSGEAVPHSGTYSAYTGCVGSSCLDPFSGAYLYQDLATGSGTIYTLTFWYWPDQGTPNELDVRWNGNLVLSIVNDLSGHTYSQITVGGLQATSTTTRLQFNGRQDPAWLNIDDVSVEATVSGVPEPGTVFLLASGLIAVFLRRFRQK